MKTAIATGVLAGVLIVLAGCGKGDPRLAQPVAPPAPTCPANDSGITLTPGFCATIFADNLGHARHMTVSPEGVVYVNTWSGLYYGFDTPPEGGFGVALQDQDGDGKAESVQRFGPSAKEKATGGTGIALYNGYLYVEHNDSIVRYKVDAANPLPSGKAETVLAGLPMSGDHMMHPFVIDKDGNLFVNSGSASNTCEAKARQPGSKGLDPCNELRTRAGLWRYDANKLNQRFSPAERWVTGLRNSGGQAFDAEGTLYAVQHGRDQLPENWPALYTAEAGRELPAEELVVVEKDADYGWPYCYFDGQQRRRVRAPEYGGDGKAEGDCGQKRAPAAHFPAHWAPNAVLISTGTQFPEAWRGGAFIAFHGSWNRAPLPQGGYNVVYQPLLDKTASDPWVVFADGFAGSEKAPGRATHRPSGLAMGPDGALYISDDVKGRIWRVTHLGGTAPTAVAAAPAPEAVAPGSGMGPIPLTALRAPEGSAADVLAQGEKVFRSATCTGCHGSDGRGTQVGVNLTTGKWLWSDGSVAGIRSSIVKGVPQAKQGIGAMPPMGGVTLSEAELDAVTAYVWALGHSGG